MIKPNIKWYRCEKAASHESIAKAEKEIHITFPRGYINLMLSCDAGIPFNTDFEYYDESLKCVIPQSMGGFLGVEHEVYNIINLYKTTPEFFPDKLIAFAETGNGDYICFDYRNGKDNLDPPIVYWNHEADVGKDVSFVANNFEEFLSMLREPED